MRICCTLILLLFLADPVRADIEEDIAKLRSEDPAVALAAAESLDPERLSLAELRLQAAILSRHPERVFVSRKARQGMPFIPADCFGAVDLPTIFAAAAELEREPDSKAFFELHRALTAGQIPALVQAMADSKPAAQGHLIRLFDTFLRSSDAQRAPVLRGLCLEFELPKAEVELPDSKLPDAFKLLVERAWRLNNERRYLQNWLRRWSCELQPAPEDLEFLAHWADWVEWPPNRALFVRLIGRIESEGATKLLRELAAREADEIAVFAAAELARDGETAPLLSFLAAEPPPLEARTLAFEVLPDVAIEAWLKAFRRADPERPPLALYPDDLDKMESWYGVRIPIAVLDRLAAGVLAKPAPLPAVVTFFTSVHPDALVGSALDEIVRRLLGLEKIGENGFFVTTYGWVLAYLSVRAPEQLEKILAAWKPQLTEDQFSELTGRYELSRFDPEDSLLSVRARAAGQPPEILDLLDSADLWAPPAELHTRMEALAEEGDWVGAVIAFVDAFPKRAYALGKIDDPRVLPFLRRLRDERRNRWSAVAGLARAGDESAREEWRGLVLDGRMWILYELPEGAACLWGDPEFVPLWIERIETTCCVGNHAMFAVGEAFPTLRFNDLPYAYPIIRRRIAAWYERHRGSFRWTSMAGGLVPVR